MVFYDRESVSVYFYDLESQCTLAKLKNIGNMLYTYSDKVGGGDKTIHSFVFDESNRRRMLCCLKLDMGDLRSRESMLQASVDNPSFEYETNFVSRKDLISSVHVCGIGRPWEKSGKRGFIYESSD